MPISFESLSEVMPVTIVQKTIGAIIIFTSLTKPSPSGLSARAEVGPVVADGDAEDQADQDLYVEELQQFADVHDVVSRFEGARC